MIKVIDIYGSSRLVNPSHIVDFFRGVREATILVSNKDLDEDFVSADYYIHCNPDEPALNEVEAAVKANARADLGDPDELLTGREITLWEAANILIQDEYREPRWRQIVLTRSILASSGWSRSACGAFMEEKWRRN